MLRLFVEIDLELTEIVQVMTNTSDHIPDINISCLVYFILLIVLYTVLYKLSH